MSRRFAGEDDILLQSLDIDEGKYTFAELRQIVGIAEAERITAQLDSANISTDPDFLFDDPDEFPVDE